MAVAAEAEAIAPSSVPWAKASVPERAQTTGTTAATAATGGSGSATTGTGDCGTCGRVQT